MVSRCSCTVLLMPQWRQFWVYQLIFVSGWNSSGVERNNSVSSGRLNTISRCLIKINRLRSVCRRNDTSISSHLSNSVQMVVEIEWVLIASDMTVPIDWSRGVLIGIPWALVSSMRCDHLLLHSPIICIYGPWLCPRLFEGLSLILKSLSVLLVCLNQLDFFLRWFIVRRLCVLTRLGVYYLLLGYSMRIWRLQRWWNCVHTELHEVRLR